MKKFKNEIIAITIVIAIFTATIFFMSSNKESKEKKPADLKLNLDSEITSTDPTISTINFIMANGTIGNVDKLKEEDIVRKKFQSNSERRKNALDLSSTAIIPNSPLINGKEQDVIDNDLGEFPVFYSIDNLKTSEPSDIYNITVEHDEIGAVEYEAVDVFADFESIQTTFYWPTDAGSDLIITQMESRDKFDEVKVTLLKSGEKWFIYDIYDSEYLLNVRLSTWSGRGEYDVSPEQKQIKEYIMEYDEINQGG